ncbi:MAG: ATP-binding cassette domain-containing protein [Actinomycetota bacterium]
MRTDGDAVRCERIERVYRTPTGEVHALHDVSCVFPRGAATAIVGPSGSGKSSLLRLIAGMDRPSSGSLVVEGRDVGRGSAAVRRRLRRDLVGYVYQRPSDNFLSHLTVGEHLRLAGRHQGARKRDLGGLLDLLGIGHRIDHLPSELSGGEQQRAAFAQALATGANIIVADEPTAELDDVSSESVLDRVRALAGEGVTFLLATHDPAVMSIADERFELEHGRVKGTAPAGPASQGSSAEPEVRWPDPGVATWLLDPEPVLRLSHVNKAYGHGDRTVHALRDVNVAARAGEVVGLIGRSGSGKTTLLNVAAGWETPDDGLVESPGDGAAGWSEIAIVPQRLGLMEELSVQENVEYPARMAGLLNERRHFIDDLIDALGLAALRSRYPRETSLGEQQRIALARALVLRPRLLIADEPTGHQDAGWAARILWILREAAGAGSCCVIASHDRELIDQLDRGFSVSDGRVTG